MKTFFAAILILSLFSCTTKKTAEPAETANSEIKSTSLVQAGGEEENISSKKKGVTIDKEKVRREIRAHLAKFKKCYDEEYKKNKNLEGKVLVSWSVDDKAQVKNIKIVSSTLNNEHVEKCTLEVFENIQFSPSPKGTIYDAKYPLLFKGH